MFDVPDDVAVEEGCCVGGEVEMQSSCSRDESRSRTMSRRKAARQVCFNKATYSHCMSHRPLEVLLMNEQQPPDHSPPELHGPDRVSRGLRLPFSSYSPLSCSFSRSQALHSASLSSWHWLQMCQPESTWREARKLSQYSHVGEDSVASRKVVYSRVTSSDIRSQLPPLETECIVQD